jgi:hypothetical protein
VAIDDAVGGVADADVGAFPSKASVLAVKGVNFFVHFADLVVLLVVDNVVSVAAGEHSIKFDVPLESNYSKRFTIQSAPLNVNTLGQSTSDNNK